MRRAVARGVHQPPLSGVDVNTDDRLGSSQAPMPGTMTGLTRDVVCIQALTVAASVHPDVGGSVIRVLSPGQRLLGARARAPGRVVQGAMRSAHPRNPHSRLVCSVWMALLSGQQGFVDPSETP